MAKSSYNIFISYERRDAGGWAAFLYRALKEKFGPGTVFKDEEETRTGEDWAPRLRRLVRDSEIFILVIGPDWSGRRVLDKLRDPESAVHGEIRDALEFKKVIFPVLVNNANGPPSTALPEVLRPAFDSYHRFAIKGMRNWDEDLKQLCGDIEARSTLTGASTPSLPSPTYYDEILCRLDRNVEADYVRQRFQDGGRLFLANGAARAGFRHFAIRCALDVLQDAGSSRGTGQAASKKELVVPLTWGKFADLEGNERRREILLEDIASALLTEPSSPTAERHENRISTWIQRNPRPTVVYSITGKAGSRLASLAGEWFRIWRGMMGDKRPQNVAVILFTESGWQPWSALGQRDVDSCDCFVRPGLGKIRREHLDEWLGSDVQRAVADQRLRRSMRNRAGRLFRFLPSRHFGDVDDAVFSIWDDSQSA